MHYGVIEKFSLKFYQQEISSQTDNPTNQTYHTQGCSLYLEEKLTLSFGLGTVILKSTDLNRFEFKCLCFAHLELQSKPNPLPLNFWDSLVLFSYNNLVTYKTYEKLHYKGEQYWFSG